MSHFMCPHLPGVPTLIVIRPETWGLCSACLPSPMQPSPKSAFVASLKASPASASHSNLVPTAKPRLPTAYPPYSGSHSPYVPALNQAFNTFDLRDLGSHPILSPVPLLKDPFHFPDNQTSF